MSPADTATPGMDFTESPLSPETARSPSARWEHGSEFAWVDPTEMTGASQVLPPSAVLYGGGSQALVAALRSGKRHLGWSRCFLPAYCCEGLVRAVLAAGLKYDVYEDPPEAEFLPRLPARLTCRDCVVVVNHFGWKDPALSELVRNTPAGLIEDHTHDPWSRWSNNSAADFCIVSLRKTLPLPDGGAAWSPRGLPLDRPKRLTFAHQQAALSKLAAMLLKALYLKGDLPEKGLFRALQTGGEQAWSERPSQPLELTRDLLHRLPCEDWRQRRRDNVHYLSAALGGLPGIQVLNLSLRRSARAADGVDFGVVLLCQSTDLREELRRFLIDRNVYPAVLWPVHRLMERSPRATDFSRRMLFLHADFRYSSDDLERVAALVREFVTGGSSICQKAA